MLHANTLALAVAAAGLGLAALALARAGWHHRAHRGWGFWVTAQLAGMLALGTASLAGPHPGWSLPIMLMLMPWPLWTLAGVRRFHARLGLSSSARVDLGVGLGAAVLALAAFMLDPLAPTQPVAHVAMLLVQLYAAVMLWSSRVSDDSAALRLLGSVAALSALAPVLHGALPGATGDAVMLTRLLSAALGLTLMAYTMLALMSERTERELRRSRRRLRVLAHVDALTGVPNRRRFHERVRRLLASGDSGPAALLLFDIDHFKQINDHLGHAAGDRALQLVGRCMQDALRTHDLAGRLGGDEFALLLPEASVEQALRVAERIVTQLQASAPRLRLPCLALSFGIAPLVPGEALDAALHRADQALYEAKRQGRSRAVAVDGDDGETTQFVESRRLGLEPA